MDFVLVGSASRTSRVATTCLRTFCVSTTGAAPLPPRSWQIPVALGPLPATRPAEVVLLQGSADLAVGKCGEAMKVNLGDIGYYRVEYGPQNRAALMKSLAHLFQHLSQRRAAAR